MTDLPDRASTPPRSSRARACCTSPPTRARRSCPPVPAEQAGELPPERRLARRHRSRPRLPVPAVPRAARVCTGLQLLNYPDASGARGTRLVPDAAAAMPTVTDGGRLYTFRIRRATASRRRRIEPVTAETFRYSIERALSPGLGPEAPRLRLPRRRRRRTAFHNGRCTARVRNLRLRQPVDDPARRAGGRLPRPSLDAVLRGGADRHPHRQRRRADPDPLGRSVLPRRFVPGRRSACSSETRITTARALPGSSGSSTASTTSPLTRLPADRGGTADYTADVLGDSQFKPVDSSRPQVRRRSSSGQARRRCVTRRWSAPDSSCSTRGRPVRERSAPACGRPRARTAGSRRRSTARSRARSTFRRRSSAAAARRGAGRARPCAGARARCRRSAAR